MRTIIFLVLIALAPAVLAGGAGGGGSSGIRTSVSSGIGGYSDPKLIVHYPLQSGLMLYKITAFKYGW